MQTEIVNKIFKRISDSIQEITKKYNNVVMIGSSNPRFNYLNEKGFLGSIGGCIVFNNGHLHPAFRTSYITKVILKDNILEFTTRNSIYTFKVKDKVETEKILFELSIEDKEIIERYITIGYTL